MEATPSPPSDGEEGRVMEARLPKPPLSSVLSPLLRRGERKLGCDAVSLRGLRASQNGAPRTVATKGCYFGIILHCCSRNCSKAATKFRSAAVPGRSNFSEV